MEFEEVRGQKDFKYWIDLTVKFKYNHLLTSQNIHNPLFMTFNKVQPIHYTSTKSYVHKFITRYDYDLSIEIVFTIFLIFLLVKTVIVKNFKKY